MTEKTLIPGNKYVHPRFTMKGGKHAYFLLVGVYPLKDMGCAIQYPDGSKFDLTIREMNEMGPYKEPVQIVRYFNVYTYGVGASRTSREDCNDSNVESELLGPRIGCKRVVFTEGEWDD